MKLLFVILVLIVLAIGEVMSLADPWVPIKDQKVIEKYSKIALSLFEKLKGQQAKVSEVVEADELPKTGGIRLIIVFKMKGGQQIQCRYMHKGGGKDDELKCPYSSTGESV